MFRIRPEVYESFQPTAQRAQGDRILFNLRRKGIAAERDILSGDVVVADQKGNQTRLSFASDGSPDRLTLPSGNSCRIDCDIKQRNVALEDARGTVLLVGRDRDSRLTRFGHPGLSEHQLHYDASSRLTEIEYPDDSRTRLTYSDSGVLAATVDRTGATTSYEYGDDGSLCAIVDALGRKTSFTLDAHGRPTLLRFPDNSSYTFAPEEPTGTRRMTLRDGSSVHQTFLDDRLKSVTWSDGEEIHFESDKHGNVKNAFRPHEDHRIACEFDETGNRISETTPDGSVSYEYDCEGRRTQIRGPGEYSAEYEYGPDGELRTIRGWGKELCRLGYDWKSGIATVSLGNGIVEAHELGIHGKVVKTAVRDRNGWLIGESEYGYDRCQRVNRILDTWGSASTQQLGRELVYDLEGRLLAEKDPVTGAITAEFDYDIKGNLIYDHGVSTVFGPMDEPVWRGDERILYDANGAVRELPGPRGTLLCEFSARGFLRKVVVDDRHVSFEYDVLGRRIAKVDGARRWRYVWAGCQLLSEEMLVDGEQAARREYVYCQDSGSPIAFREDGRVYWLQSDVRGAIVRVVDDRGEVVWFANYDSFGRASVQIEAVRQPWRLVGQYEDEETGLHYNFARYYCPWLRSYLSLDPLWMQHGATNYSYAVNDPWNRIDPLGTHPILIAAIIGAVIGAAIGAGIAWYYHASTQDIVAAAIGGAVGGAIMGAGGAAVISAAAAAGTAGIPLYLGLAKWGFLSGVAGSLTTEILDTQEGVCVPCVLVNGLISAVLAPALFGLGRWFGSTGAGKWLSGKLRFGGPKAQLGNSTTKDYTQTFFQAHPETKGNVVVHHAIEQQVLVRYPGLVTEAELHSLQNLRGIPKELNPDLHLSQIRKAWNAFYRANPSPTRQGLLDQATKIDQEFGHLFVPPIN